MEYRDNGAFCGGYYQELFYFNFLLSIYTYTQLLCWYTSHYVLICYIVCIWFCNVETRFYKWNVYVYSLSLSMEPPNAAIIAWQRNVQKKLIFLLNYHILVLCKHKVNVICIYTHTHTPMCVYYTVSTLIGRYSFEYLQLMCIYTTAQLRCESSSSARLEIVAFTIKLYGKI